MTPGAYAFIAFVVALFAVITWLALTAPEGHQDRDGYHDGPGVDEWEDGV